MGQGKCNSLKGKIAVKGNKGGGKPATKGKAALGKSTRPGKDVGETISFRQHDWCYHKPPTKSPYGIRWHIAGTRFYPPWFTVLWNLVPNSGNFDHSFDTIASTKPYTKNSRG